MYKLPGELRGSNHVSRAIRATLFAVVIAVSVTHASAQNTQVDLSGAWTGEWCYRPGVGFPGELGQCYPVEEVILEQNGDIISGAMKERNTIPPRFRSSGEQVDFFFSNLEGSVADYPRIEWTKTYENAPSMGSARFEGRVGDNGGTIEGRWIVTRNHGPLRLRRASTTD
jgi:hypothetical protein